MTVAIGLFVTICDDASAKAKRHAAVAKPQAAPKPAAAGPAQLDPVNELTIIGDEATALHRALGAAPAHEHLRKTHAARALRAARAAELALSRGDEDLFTAYREQIQTQLDGTRPALERMAERGVGVADYALGTFALHGVLEARNVERACARFAAALAKGFRGATFRHAQCIEASAPERALALLREAADSGNVAANERLGRLCLEASPPDAACARARLERAGNDGRASAKTLLGWMYANGIVGKPDFARAARYYRDAAQQGEPSASNNLGELYESGRGVARDEQKAYAHYRTAAETGFAPAVFNLGRLYAAGKGVEKDAVTARRLLEEAAKAGIADAQRLVDLLNSEGAR